MRFIITRTSLWQDESPLPEDKRIRKVTYTRIDRRTLKTLEEVRQHQIGKYWFDSGTNHREEAINGCGVARDIEGEEAWIIELNSLGELCKFIDEVEDPIVISNANGYWKDGSAVYEIEIYDSYRE